MQFGVNKHLQIFQTTKCTCPKGSCICSRAYLLNCTRNRVITYGNLIVLLTDWIAPYRTHGWKIIFLRENNSLAILAHVQ